LEFFYDEDYALTAMTRVDLLDYILCSYNNI
jgi:hypothetical protein